MGNLEQYHSRNPCDADEDDNDNGDNDNGYDDGHEDNEQFFYLDVVVDNVDQQNCDEWRQTCENKWCGKLTLSWDSGAQVNILPESIFRKTDSRLEDTNVTLRSYSGHIMKPVGQAACDVKVGKRIYSLNFQVVADNVRPLLGLRACEEMNLMKRCDIDNVTNKCAGKVANSIPHPPQRAIPSPHRPTPTPSPAKPAGPA